MDQAMMNPQFNRAMLNLTSTTMKSPMADVPAWEGIIALLITVVGLGTYHVPIRTFPAGDGQKNFLD
jgi:hypothetical protein